MFLPVLVYLLTPLALVVVVLTRLRLRGDGDIAGRLQISNDVLRVHTVAGGLAWVLWVLFLVLSLASVGIASVLGIVALGLWWVTTVVGLLILARWLPARGKHADGPSTDSWAQGPWLSVLAHVGLLVGTIIFTIAYLVAAV